MNILVIRFRQMGDAILSMVVLNSLKKSFPGCKIDYVLNENLCDLFRGHPSIDRLIPFSYEECHNIWKYIYKVYHIVHSTHYDVIIDMRGTFKTTMFAMFSPSTKYRIGLKKKYTKFAFSYLVEKCRPDQSMIDHHLCRVKPLAQEGKLVLDPNFTLFITSKEQDTYDRYLQSKGIDLTKPILLAGVTAKLEGKTWDKDRMTWVIRKFIENYLGCKSSSTTLQVRKRRTPTAFIKSSANPSRYIST